MDEHGLYGRSEMLLLGLLDLGRLHNMLCNALRQWSRRNYDRFWAEIQTASDFHKPVVQTPHYQQFPNLLAILLLFKRHRLSNVRTLMAKHLYNCAKVNL
jgi:hypothetical protein